MKLSYYTMPIIAKRSRVPCTHRRLIISTILISVSRIPPGDAIFVFPTFPAAEWRSTSRVVGRFVLYVNRDDEECDTQEVWFLNENRLSETNRLLISRFFSRSAFVPFFLLR